MKIMLLAGLYLFFMRVLWSVFNELRDPRTVARKAPPVAAPTAKGGAQQTMRAPGPAASGSGRSGKRGGVATLPAVTVGQLTLIEPTEFAGSTFRLGSDNTMGRGATNTIVLEDTYASTVHARIFKIDNGFFLEDLASRNGSLLNGVPVTATTALTPGDVVHIGTTLMEFS